MIIVRPAAPPERGAPLPPLPRRARPALVAGPGGDYAPRVRSWPHSPRAAPNFRARPPAPDRGPRGADVVTVSELTRRIRGLLEGQFSNVVVEGEVSGFRPSSTGHYYFNLVDRSATLGVALFKNRHFLLTFIPADGMLVRVRGAISVYGPRSSYQLIADGIERAGEGDLLALLERRKRALAAEGLFDGSRKRPLPLLPRRVAVVTSPTGAAVRDLLRVLGRRNAGVDVLIVPAPVQGPDAAARIARGVRTADRRRLGDVIIVTRGGGALEDLLPFSDERVVRAIAAAATPVISAVGHEVDSALSDLAADHRAATPSAAAEVVAAPRRELRRRVAALRANLGAALEGRAQRCRTLLERYRADHLARSLRLAMHPRQQRLDEARALLCHAAEQRARSLRHRLALAAQGVEAASPRAILQRGYAAVTDVATGSYVTSAQQVRAAQEVRVQLHRSAFRAAVTATEPAAQETGDGDL